MARGKKFWTRIVLVVAICLIPTSLPAQGRRNAVFFGGAIGGGAMPGAYRAGCFHHDDLGTPTASTLADFRAGAPVGPIALEVRLTGETRLPGPTSGCEYVEPAHPSGKHTDRIRGLDGGDHLATDLRVRYESSPRWAFVATSGLGYVWPHGIPFLLAGIGLRTPGRLRGALDLEWNRHRVPFDELTREWTDYEVVREVSRRREYDWQAGWSVRLGAELRI